MKTNLVAELTEEREREAQLQERRKQVAGSIQQLKKMKETLEGRIKCVAVCGMGSTCC